MTAPAARVLLALRDRPASKTLHANPGCSGGLGSQPTRRIVLDEDQFRAAWSAGAARCAGIHLADEIPWALCRCAWPKGLRAPLLEETR